VGSRGVVVSCERAYDAPHHIVGGRSKGMGNARPRLKLMPEKLLLIREYLKVSQPSRVSEYENGVREPNLMVTLKYSRLGKVSMASVVDDEINVHEFQGQLGKFELAITKQEGRSKQRDTQRTKPVTLISGCR